MEDLSVKNVHAWFFFFIISLVSWGMFLFVGYFIKEAHPKHMQKREAPQRFLFWGCLLVIRVDWSDSLIFLLFFLFFFRSWSRLTSRMLSCIWCVSRGRRPPVTFVIRCQMTSHLAQSVANGYVLVCVWAAMTSLRRLVCQLELLDHFQKYCNPGNFSKLINLVNWRFWHFISY